MTLGSPPPLSKKGVKWYIDKRFVSKWNHSLSTKLSTKSGEQIPIYILPSMVGEREVLDRDNPVIEATNSFTHIDVYNDIEVRLRLAESAILYLISIYILHLVN